MLSIAAKRKTKILYTAMQEQWSIFFIWDIFLPVVIIAGTIITVCNSFIVWKERKQNNHFLLEKAWIRLCVIPMHFPVGGFFVAFWKLTEQM